MNNGMKMFLITTLLSLCNATSYGAIKFTSSDCIFNENAQKYYVTVNGCSLTSFNPSVNATATPQLIYSKANFQEVNFWTWTAKNNCYAVGISTGNDKSKFIWTRWVWGASDITITSDCELKCGYRPPGHGYVCKKS